MSDNASLAVKIKSDAGHCETGYYSIFGHKDGGDGDLSPIIRDLFRDASEESFDMNWLLLSTSGVHGSYTTLDGIERDENADSFDEDGNFRITVLAIKPRIVQIIFGNGRFHRSEIPWLRKAVGMTLAAIEAGQQENIKSDEQTP